MCSFWVSLQFTSPVGLKGNLLLDMCLLYFVEGLEQMEAWRLGNGLKQRKLFLGHLAQTQLPSETFVDLARQFHLNFLHRCAFFSSPLLDAGNSAELLFLRTLPKASR